MIIMANVLHQTLTAKAEGPLVAGSVEAVTCEAVFDPSWDGLTKVLVFSLSEPGRVLPPDQGNVTWLAQRSVTCLEGPVTVPWEVLTRPGMLYISAVGLDGDLVRPTVRQACLSVLPNGGMPGETGQEPSPELWEQAIQAATEAAVQAQAAADAAEATVQEFQDGMAGDLVPQIGDNGNWFLLGADSGCPSRGEAGYSPVKGVDYCTDEDRAELVQAVLGALPQYAGEVI